MSRRDFLSLVLTLGVTGCEQSQPGPGFEQDIVPIFNRHCVMCHMVDGAQGELSLHPAPHAALVERASVQSDLLLVAPGDVEGSYLYHKLLGSHLEVGGEGASMPYQRDLLQASELNAIKQWIVQGAGNN